MKLVHLSDLHIGKRFNDFSLMEDQSYILDQILEIIDREKPQAVLLCGDIYDKSTPSAEAVSLFDDFLCRLARRNTTVLIISGNHDSAERLAFGNRLFTENGIHISPVYNGDIKPVTLEDEWGSVDFWLLPFVKPMHVRRFFPDAQIENYTDAVRVAIENMPMDKTKRNVLLTHQFVTGCSAVGSEELTVGGTDNVDTSVFEDFCYVALGHIHGQQNLGGSNHIRYCGTPLKYSFSEESHHKSVTVTELDGDGGVKVTLCPLTPLREVRTICGTFAYLTDSANYIGTPTKDYLRVFLHDEDDVPEAMGKLMQIYPNIMELRYDNTRTRANQVIEAAENVQEKTPLQLFEELYEKQNNQPMSEEQRNLVLELLDGIGEGNV
ncbi:MAG: exonuclease SbcCD subunit D [Oscillospiraceae bacterium]|nr:exonuclease SbcCD subunit D [Oscillospiraceae bacterium]